ncbi:hypothetical protein [Nocardioides sp.]|jgi:Na+/H+-translocating membrane pyrophosphatase|uniref:hypothetical protein n=1 Tax=Nocardioides sp. TaxID=35761 RepID=UPI00262C1363|nr:hypothetical protein [Nocardioides sp.]
MDFLAAAVVAVVGLLAACRSRRRVSDAPTPEEGARIARGLREGSLRGWVVSGWVMLVVTVALLAFGQYLAAGLTAAAVLICYLTARYLRSLLGRSTDGT